MTVNLTVNGQTFAYPTNRDEDWGIAATGWANAVTSGMLQKAGGVFTLTADVNFGANYGLISTYFKSRSADIADAGQIRLARSDVISFRNEANNANLDLAVNSSDELTFDGNPIGVIQSVGNTTTIDLDITANVLTASVNSGSLTNTQISPSAGIALSKLATTTAARALSTSVSGLIEVSTTTATELGYLSGVTSSVQTQLDGKVTNVMTTNGDMITRASGVPARIGSVDGGYVTGLSTGTSFRRLSNDISPVISNLLVTATASAGDLTVSATQAGVVMGDAHLAVRSVTATNGSVQSSQIITNPTTLTVPSGATLGHSSGVPAYIYVYWIDQASSAANSIAVSSTRYDDGSIVSTTTISTGADSASAIYNASSQSNKVIRCIGRILSSQATAGDWQTSPTEVTIAGLFNEPRSYLNSSVDLANVDQYKGIAATPTTNPPAGYYKHYFKSDGNLYKLDSAGTETQLNGSSFSNPMTTNGDLITQSGGVPARLAIGANGTVLSSNGTSASWQTPSLPAINEQVSSSTASFNTTSGTYVDVTNATCTITTTGRTVEVILIPTVQTTDASQIRLFGSNKADVFALFRLQRGGTTIGVTSLSNRIETGSGTADPVITVSPSFIYFKDVALAAGTYTYNLQTAVNSGDTVEVTRCRLYVRET